MLMILEVIENSHIMRKENKYLLHLLQMGLQFFPVLF